MLKRLLVGRPRHSARLSETLLPKWLALPVFCSDPISSVAYATEQIVLVLGAGGLAALTWTPWVGLAVVVLLVVVVASYRQTCYAYPGGGGAFAVSRDNLGESASLVAASASVISQVAASVFGAHGAGSVLFYLASILGQHRYLPRQLHNRGDRLVFSNGILLLAAFAVALIIGFDANIDELIQLYIIGVFTSFTLSQCGMVRHWNRELAGTIDRTRRRAIRRSQAINLIGAICTAVVLVVVFATKIEHGAWLAVAAMIVLFFLMRAVNRYYAQVSAEVAAEDTPPMLPSSVHAVVLVSRLHKPALRALAFARANRPDVLEAVTMATDEAETRELRQAWQQHGVPVPLKVLDAPYRDLLRPLLEYIQRLRRDEPRAVIAIYIPEYVTSRWWQNLLHNQSALRIKARDGGTITAEDTPGGGLTSRSREGVLVHLTS